MKSDEIKLVKQSWAKVQPTAEQAAELFYRRLFGIAPHVRPLFKGDMKVQGRALMGMINTVVMGLGRLDELLPAIQDLGRRHRTYGVKDADYDSVGAALLWTLEQGLKEDFTPKTKAAWSTAYNALASTMKGATRQS